MGTHLEPLRKIWRKAFLLLPWLILTGTVAQAQVVNLGIPPVRNFSRKAYQAGTQTWDATQDARGILYFANNDGLLRFDGNRWSILPVSNHTIVRSAAAGPEGRIYAGAQNELGYFAPDAAGRLSYTSLIALLPPGDRHFEDVWDIVVYEEAVFFRTNRQVFRYDGQQMQVILADADLQGLFPGPEGPLLQAGFGELQVWTGEGFTLLSTLPNVDCPITGVLAWTTDTLLLTTLKQGIYALAGGQAEPWPTRADALLREKRIYSAAMLLDGRIVLGTSLDGLVVLDRHRRVDRHLTNSTGLQNNNVLSVFTDLAGNTWCGLNNGIDCVVFPSRFTAIYPDDELRGTGYAAIRHDDRLYLGVSNGLYTVPWSDYYAPVDRGLFSLVPNTAGQTWGLSESRMDLWLGHHEGAFRIRGTTAERVSPEPGYWTFVELSPDRLLAGSYEGLSIFRQVGDRWILEGLVEGLRESCRILVKDRAGAVWVSHPYRGVYRIQWNSPDLLHPEIRFFDQSAGLPSNLNNYVFRIAGRAVVGTEKGVYTFDAGQERFIPDPDFTEILGHDERVKYLKEDEQGAIWYVMGDEVGRLRVEDSGLRKNVGRQVFPELSGKLVGGFETIYPIDACNVLFGAEEGFIHYADCPAPGDPAPIQVWLTEVRTEGKTDSILYGGYPAPGASDEIVLAASLDNLRFTYSATEYALPDLVEYRTRLDGMDDDWTPWTTETRRTVTNIGPGSHAFRVQARIRGGAVSEEISFPFRLRPRWYAGMPARAFYGLLVIGFFAFVVMRQRRRFDRKTAQMRHQHAQVEAERIREVEVSRARLTEIRKEKLEADIQFKNQELAMTTMHLVQKAEILLTVQEALNNIRAKAVAPDVRREIKQLLNLLNFDVKVDEDWDHFAQYFDQVHVDFLKNLRERFPQLSANDYKLCAYLRMNLSTKEIAPLLNISVRGVEGSRYRLRKKLDLPSDANLTEFIMNLPPSIARTPDQTGNENGQPALEAREESTARQP